jgi:uncharacterized membrane protein YdbT with pleckstrin-like domain
MERTELHFKPHHNLHFKRNILAFLMTGVFFGATVLVLYLDDDYVLDKTFWYICAGIFPTVFIGWVIYNFLYIRRVRIVIKTNEIIIKRGILQIKEKIIPYQAITNLSIFRDIFDRIFRLGSIRVQTAGHSGEKTPEMRIQGIVNFVEIYDILMVRMKRIARISPDEEMQDISEVKIESLIEVRKAILQEFLEIKELLRKRRG